MDICSKYLLKCYLVRPRDEWLLNARDLVGDRCALHVIVTNDLLILVRPVIIACRAQIAPPKCTRASVLLQSERQ